MSLKGPLFAQNTLFQDKKYNICVEKMCSFYATKRLFWILSISGPLKNWGPSAAASLAYVLRRHHTSQANLVMFHRILII